MPDRKESFWTNKSPYIARAGQLTQGQMSLFPSSEGKPNVERYGNNIETGFRGKNGTVKDPYRTMTIGRQITISKKARRGFKKTDYRGQKSFTKSYYRFKNLREFQLKNGMIKSDMLPINVDRMKNRAVHSQSFDAFMGKGTIKLPNFQWMILTLKWAATRLPISANNWKVVVAKRAQKVFQDSFKLKKFNSDGEKRWKANTSWTVKKRKWRGTWPGAGKLMQETNELYNSMKFFNPPSILAPARVRVHRRGAVVHNDPEPGDTYGRGFGTHSAKPVVRRQFMGHSTEIEKFENTYIDNYFFYDIWRAPMSAPIG